MFPVEVFGAALLLFPSFRHNPIVRDAIIHAGVPPEWKIPEWTIEKAQSSQAIRPFHPPQVQQSHPEKVHHPKSG